MTIEPIEKTGPWLAEQFRLIANKKHPYVKSIVQDGADIKVNILDNTQGVTQRDVSRVGRNDLCPCGSGKKYKKCCMPT